MFNTDVYNFLWDQSSFPILKLIQMCQINQEIASSLTGYKVEVSDPRIFQKGKKLLYAKVFFPNTT